MAGIEVFESALKDVVKAKKLSQSKMDTLRDVALKCMENDTQMVSILYRTHKGLSSTGKIWSLYAFDAVARAARHQVNKNRIVPSGDTERGNCASFLLKVEAILDGLFQDILSTGTAELKEKAKKILDIWIKSHTFPSAVLSSLVTMLGQAEQEKEPDQAIRSAAAAIPTPNCSALPVPPTHQPPTPTAPAANSVDVQTTLLALLSQAANAVETNAIQTSSTTSQTAANNAPALDANQLAFLQQLAQAATQGSGNAVHAPLQQHVPVPASALVVPSLTTTSHAVPVAPPPMLGGGPPRMPYRDSLDHHDAARRESEYQPYGVDRSYQNHGHDPRRGGAFSQRGFRARGGVRGRGRWNDREMDHSNGGYHRRDFNHAVSYNNGKRSSRSRSPPGRSVGTNGRAHSPPRRAPYQEHGPEYGGTYTYASAAPGAEPLFDEFGRELRAQSPTGSDVASTSARHPPQNHAQESSPPLPGSASVSVSASDRGSAAPDYPDQHPPHFPSETSTSTALSPGHERQQQPPSGGLASFDRTTFDPAQPASWEALAEAWKATHGSMPSQSDLVQFVFGNGQLAETNTGAANAGDFADASPDRQRWERHGEGGGAQRGYGQRGGWRGRGGGGGDGQSVGRGYGRGRGGYGGRGGFRGDGGRGRGHGFGLDGGHERGEYGNGNRGGYENGNAAGHGAFSAGGRGFGGYQETDAVMLAGDGSDDHEWSSQSQPVDTQWQAQEQVPEGSAGGGDGGGRGKMQKVGDKWVFVRGAA